MQGFEVSDAGPRVQGFKKRGLKSYLYCFEVLPIIVIVYLNTLKL